ncbi:hypothetical protein [Methylopila sp. 73B]|uniref:hypothetical protein n=1 Tax=Methylopila sp. 73B TaxID=1120792 RepID=UPI000374A58C|nr:hypothetical protein [Methylopila sp. 73B]
MKSTSEIRKLCSAEAKARLKAETRLAEEVMRADTAERDLRNMTLEMRRLKERCERAEAEVASLRRIPA